MLLAFQIAKISSKEAYELNKRKFKLIIDKTSEDVSQAIKILSDNTTNCKEMILMTKIKMALALNELIDDNSIENVEEKYGIPKHRLQSLKYDAGNFAKMAASFCKKLEWEKHELSFTELTIKCLPREKFDLEECLSQKTARDSKSEDTAAMLSAPPQKKQKIEHQPQAADSTRKTAGNEKNFLAVYQDTLSKMS